MEITTQKIDTDIKYSQDDKEEIVAKVVSDFDSWNDDRSGQITLIKKVADLLDMSTSVQKTEIGEKKSELVLKDADIKEICNSSIAHAYNGTFKTPSQMFNVELETETSDSEKSNFAFMQKASILNILKKSKAKKEFRKCVNNIYKKGEAILYVNWKQEYQNVRRKTGFKYAPLGIDLQKWEVRKELKYDGAKLKSINPEYFVFDTSADDFETASKIYKSWVTYSSIANNENYKKFISKDDLAELKELTKGQDKDNSDIKTDSEEEKAFKDGMIECLEYQGDISVKKDGDTKLYPNMKVVVIARKYVACFMYNPNIDNSFVYYAPDTDPKTGRGIPPLACLIPHSEATTATLNKINKALGLTINKCYLTPKGCFKGNLEVKENGMIEYDAQLMPQAPEPLDFSSGLNHGLNFLQYLEGKKEQATGRFKYSTGDSGAKPRTAKEAQITQTGQDALVSYENDELSDFVITVIEKIGQLQANFQDKPTSLKYKDATGAEQNGVVDETVTQGNYIYTIGDTQTSIEKKMNGLEALQALPQIQQLLASKGQSLDVNKVVEMWGSIYDQENPSKIIAQEEQKQTPPPPQPNAIIAELATQTLEKSQLPDDLKMIIASEIGLIPNGINTPTEAEGNQSPPVMPNGDISGIQQPIPPENLQ